jgi:hypothetical protein
MLAAHASVSLIFFAILPVLVWCSVQALSIATKEVHAAHLFSLWPELISAGTIDRHKWIQMLLGAWSHRCSAALC